MFYAVLAEVVYVAKLTNKYILLKYNCTGKFFGIVCCLYDKTVILITLVVYELIVVYELSAHTVYTRLELMMYVLINLLFKSSKFALCRNQQWRGNISN